MRALAALLGVVALTLAASGLRPSPQERDDAPGLAFLAVGDVGTGDASQRAVARAMAARARSHGADFVLVLGDLFYPRGVTSADDPQWRTAFVEPYSLEGLQIPFHVALGNHDYLGEPDVMVGWDGDPRWRLPAPYYRSEHELDGDTHVEVFVLDTSLLLAGGETAAEQLAWLGEALERSTAAWRLVAGHHPLHSSGEHGGSRRLERQLAPLFERHGVDLYLCGHDHHLELLEPECCPPHVISGAGAKTRDVDHGDGATFTAKQLGFAWLRVERDELRVEFVSKKGETLFTKRFARATASAGG